MSDSEKPSTPPSKQEIMREIGAAIAERRKIRGMTVEKVAQVLKIRIPYIKAMEKGEWSDLPGEVYARGFIKRYAQFLGLDGEKLMAPYLAERPTSTEHEDMPGPTGGSDVSRGVLITIAVVSVFVIVMFKLVNQDRPAPASVPAEAPAQPAVPVLAPSPVAEAREPAAGEPHRIEVHSPFPLWLRVSADDRNFEGFIPQGSTWNWSAKGKFTVRLGHSRQVSILFDGQPVELRENQKRVDLPNET